MKDDGREKSGRGLEALLLATVLLPALAVSWGLLDGKLAFVLYREPKRFALSVLGWILVSTLVWARRRELSPARVFATLRRPSMMALGAFLGYLAATGLWVRVRENHFSELNQYLLLFVLLVLLLLWAEGRRRVRTVVTIGLLSSLGAVTLVGLMQAIRPLPWLPPIDSDLGAEHPSLFGYKNPTALAVLGQIFLLARWVFGKSRLSPRQRLALFVLLATELIYLVTLVSRTSYVAVAVGTLFLLVLGLARRRERRKVVAATVAAALAAVWVVTAAVVLIPRARETATRYLARTDRGTYFLNTLNMARHRPLGVGLGDWQTQYPVYRLHNRSLAFTAEIQVRRAHSDHVQFLGEGGWPGLALWLTFLAVLVGRTVREHLRTGSHGQLFLAAQLVAFATAMATDYLVDLPYHKAQLFFVFFLALSGRRSQTDRESGSPHAAAVRLVAVAVTALALLQVTYHVCLFRKVHLAAAMEKTYLEATAGKADPADATDACSRVVELGVTFAALPGHTKTFYKDWLLLAQCAYLRGQRDAAVVAARRALELRPFDPETFRLLARIATDARTSFQWREAAEYLTDEATSGFEQSLPPLP